MKLIIGGYEPFTLTDFPGNVAAVVYTQGCNFRCPFCHNGSLLSLERREGADLAVEWILDHLRRRCRQLDGVVLSGGEPTLQPGLEAFLVRVKELDLEVKLDTNGSHPEVIERLLERGLVDAVAMDVKAPPDRYRDLAGVEVDPGILGASMSLIAQSGVEHEFRTTFVKDLLSYADLNAIGRFIPFGSRHRVQPFHRELALDPHLRVQRERT